ncbi:hypothetical protein ACFLY8_03155 [Halobacteriota archaeon]
MKKTNQRFRKNEDARIPVISIILLVAFVGIFAAMVATYVLVPEPTPVPISRPTPKPTPPPTISEVGNLSFENVVVYASERSTGEESFDTVVMQVTGTGVVSHYDIVATVNGVGGYIRSTGGTPIQPGEEVTFVSMEKYAACGCPQPIVEIEPGDPVHVKIRHTKTRHAFVDTTVTAIAGP